MSVSIVIPAYNEASRIIDTLQRIVQCSLFKLEDTEVIVVDDGSQDQTSALVRDFAKEAPCVRLIRNEVNRGKGFAVRQGVLDAQGEIILFVDADNSTPIEEAQKLFPCILEKKYDIAIGSRAHQESDIRLKQFWPRRTMGKIFNICVRFLRLSNFLDTQCGFKCFSRRSAQMIFPLQRVDRFAFDVEILMIAQIYNLTVCEIPIVWINSRQSKVNPIRDAAYMLYDLVRIKMNVCYGVYRDPSGSRHVTKQMKTGE